MSTRTNPSMTPRQRVLAALRRQEPDRTPRELSWGSFTPALMQIFRARTCAEDPAEYWNYEVRSVEYHNPPPDEAQRQRTLAQDRQAQVDSFGVGHLSGAYLHFEDFVHPLAGAQTLNEILDYPLPDLTAPACWAHLAPETAALQARQLAAASTGDLCVFETAFALRGLEALLADLLLNPEMAQALFERLTALRAFQVEAYARAGCDVLLLGDDVASQRGMLMSPPAWRRFLKPCLARLIEAARRVKPEILIFYHSDGDCRAIIPELIEVGVDILNPVQPECMDPVALKAQYGLRLSFWGCIGTQTTFPFGSPAEVRAAVHRLIETVGRGGGLLLAPTHVLEPEVPWENVLAFFDAIEAYYA
jgi:uroporphyrinogen decarboxylase